jgi:uncharacterized membrane-anchored protein YjiN (DUF445 family)
MLALLLTCAIFRAEHASLGWLLAFAEAAAVGAMADWYAVNALFRRPLGLPIPHTAIIPRNQRRIAESLGNFVAENFLTPQLVIGRLSEYNAVKVFAEWLVAPANSLTIAAKVTDFVPRMLDGLDEADLAEFFDRSVMPHLREFDVSCAAGNILELVTDDNRHQPLLDRGLRALEQWLMSNSALLKAKFSAASKYTPAQLDAYIVDRFIEGIVALLHEVAADQRHGLRQQFDRAVKDLIAQLQTSRVHRRFGKSLMRDYIRHLRGEDHFGALLRRLRTAATADANRRNSVLRRGVANVLIAFGKRLRAAPAMQETLNAWWLNVAHTLIVTYRHQIPALVTEVVKGWDSEEVIRKIEGEIGRDLQFIRINGTLVGGITGVLLHAATLLVTRLVSA